jgi:hypothetical protein
MKAHQRILARVMALLVGLVCCGLPECAQAWQQQSNPMQQPGQSSGTSIDPSQGPLQPAPSQNQPLNLNPSQPESSTDLLQATPAPQPKAEQQMQQPLGAATAEGVPTVGGAASRPAGEAIAPAKQNQRHSLLLKVGLIAAVGVAGGTVYALSKGTSGKP